MNLEFDQDKRDQTLRERGLDFARAAEVFEGVYFTGRDERFESEEERFITIGHLDTRLVVLVWTPRDKVRRIISMRKANDREKAFYKSHLA